MTISCLFSLASPCFCFACFALFCRVFPCFAQIAPFFRSGRFPFQVQPPGPSARGSLHWLFCFYHVVLGLHCWCLHLVLQITAHQQGSINIKLTYFVSILCREHLLLARQPEIASNADLDAVPLSDSAYSSDQSMFSRTALAPKLASGGCCMDDRFSRYAFPCETRGFCFLKVIAYDIQGCFLKGIAEAFG